MSNVQESAIPIIYYSLIAFNTKIICEVDEYDDDKNSNKNHTETMQETVHPLKEKKYIRASKKILKKIEDYEVRRPDGMGTLISGTYSYNYIHGFDYHVFEKYPLLESLIFLCVLPLYQSNPNVTLSEREIAFNFLSSVRRNFLTAFAAKLNHIYEHENILHIAVRIDCNENMMNDPKKLNEEDMNICNGLRELSQIMKQRMHGNYVNECDYLDKQQKEKEKEKEEISINPKESEDDNIGNPFISVSDNAQIQDLKKVSEEDKETQFSE